MVLDIIEEYHSINGAFEWHGWMDSSPTRQRDVSQKVGRVGKMGKRMETQYLSGEVSSLFLAENARWSLLAVIERLRWTCLLFCERQKKKIRKSSVVCSNNTLEPCPNHYVHKQRHCKYYYRLFSWDKTTNVWETRRVVYLQVHNLWLIIYPEWMSRFGAALTTFMAHQNNPTKLQAVSAILEDPAFLFHSRIIQNVQQFDVPHQPVTSSSKWLLHYMLS